MTFSLPASALLSSVENKSSTDVRFMFLAELFNFQHLLCEISVSFRCFAFIVMGENALTLGGASAALTERGMSEENTLNATSVSFSEF